MSPDNHLEITENILPDDSAVSPDTNAKIPVQESIREEGNHDNAESEAAACDKQPSVEVVHSEHAAQDDLIEQRNEKARNVISRI